MGPDRHVLTFPVNHGATLNVVAFASTDKPWPSETSFTLPATREECLADFEGFGSTIRRLIRMTTDKPDRVRSVHLPYFCPSHSFRIR